MIANSRKEVLRVRCFVGGENSTQQEPLLLARTHLLNVPEYALDWTNMNVDLVKAQQWRPRDLIDWLSDCDFYLIIAHIHQGLLDTLGWNVEELKECLEFLYYKNGFPSRDELFCPVFLQDKYSYISTMKDFCNPTLKIDLSLTSEDGIDRAKVMCDVDVHRERYSQIIRFMKDHSEGEGWVVKAPFTTNCDFIKFCQTYDQILRALRAAEARFGDQIPYVMVQPTMFNRREEKVVLVNGKAFHVASQSMNKKSPHCHKFAMTNEELFEFAEEAVKTFKTRDPSFIMEGLVRVDIFCTRSGKLVVNEFESLEAAYFKTFDAEVRVKVALSRYWEDILRNCILQCILDRAISVDRSNDYNDSDDEAALSK